MYSGFLIDEKKKNRQKTNASAQWGFNGIDLKGEQALERMCK